MRDLAILRAFGSSNERLKQVLTALPNDEFKKKVPGESKDERKERLAKARQNASDVDNRKRVEEQARQRIEAGILWSLKNWRMYAAVDIAWDSQPITKTMIPLLMYAQGKVNVESASKLLSGTAAENCLKRDDGGKVVSVDIPRFVETHVNLVRSVISRRHAAQKNKYNGLDPYYEFLPRGTSQVDKCRADVLSQRVEVMVDQFGNRHHDAQVMRDGMLYGHVVDFPMRPWEVHRQWRQKDVAPDAKDVESYVVKEGINWFNPHPTRVFYDTAWPLAALNEDVGPEWVGFWDVKSYREIEDNPHYFNKDQISFSGKLWNDVTGTFGGYFNQYAYTIYPPASAEEDIARDNDRKAVQGMYTSTYRDSSVFVTNYYDKIVPKDYNIGEYPFPVWVHKVVTSNGTCVFAEFMPSSPCAVLSINESDGRMFNVSMAHDLMGYQDQMTNLLTQLLFACQLESFKAIGINTDLLEPVQVKAIQDHLKNPNWATENLVYSFSLKKMEQLGIKTDGVIQIDQARQGQTIASIFDAIMKLVALVERMMALSPNEQGQPAPREISATEVAAIGTTTTTIYSAISGDIDEFRAAKKRIIYESLVSCSESEVNCPVKQRYTEKTVREAGFVIKGAEDFKGEAKRFTVIGTKKALQLEVVFGSRDGDERPINTQGANTLVQLISQVLAVPAIAQAMGKEKLYELFNEVFRMSGAGVDLNLQLKEGEDNSLGMDEMTELKQTVEQMQQFMQQMAQQTSQVAQSVQSQEQVNQQQEEAITSLAKLAEQVGQVAQGVEELKATRDEVQTKILESIKYSEAPPSVRRQLESKAGLLPATELEQSPLTPQPPKPTTKK